MIVKPQSKTTKALIDVSVLLEYPTAQTHGQAKDWLAQHGQINKGAEYHLRLFLEKFSTLTLSEAQELFTRTFDLAPICVPYISSYIYGDENYERGELMIRLNDHFEKHKIDRLGELPDHIALLLRYADSFTEEELSELSTYCLLEPIKQMTSNIGEGDNPYFHVLKAVQSILETSRG